MNSWSTAIAASLVAFIASHPRPATAQWLEAGELFNFCHEESAPQERSYCLGWFHGYWNGVSWGGAHIYFEKWDVKPENFESVGKDMDRVFGFCAPNTLEPNDLRKLFRGFLISYPAAQKWSASRATHGALMQQYPCE